MPAGGLISGQLETRFVAVITGGPAGG